MMGIPRSTYYFKAKGATPAEKVFEANLRDEIERIVLQWPHYGYRRVTAELRRKGTLVNHKRVARVMRENSLQCQVKRKFLRPKNKKTGKERYFFFNNLIRGKKPKSLNEIWVADITYVRLEQDFVFVAVILDLYSRRVIGWAISPRIQIQLTLAALKMALLSRKPKPGCIHHSDRGGQYASLRYVETLKKSGLRISMSRPGYPYDNAVVESFMKTLKQEEVDMTEYKSFDDLKGRIPYFLEKVYNEKRLHSKLGYVPPEEFESRRVKKSKPKIFVRVS